MDNQSPIATEREESVVQIGEQRSSAEQLKDNRGSTNDAVETNHRSTNSGSSGRQTDQAPEKKLTRFALSLAVLEKSATGLGQLAFIWATVVLLGGFAVTLKKIDFWVITAILLIEGTRIFSRSHELEWQHQATGLSKFFSIIFYFLQVLSACACASLSLMRLIQQDYGEIIEGGSDIRNRKSALNIFYSLAVAEALLFLMEKSYLEWNLRYCKLLKEVNKECKFEDPGEDSIRRFFYAAYSRCVNGSVFDGSKRDLVSFAVELLASDSSDDQLTGDRILQKFMTSRRFSKDTVGKIATSTRVMERLVDMLNWKKPEEEEIRKLAAEIVLKLAEKKQNALRVAGIPGAMVPISSLLDTGGFSGHAADEHPQNVNTDQVNYDHTNFNLLGIKILERLAHYHDDICGKIGNTRGLLSKIIYLAHAGEWLLKGDSAKKSDNNIILVERSLKLVKTLASAQGNTGEDLRRKFSENVFTINNIRKVLQHGYGKNYRELQKQGIEILKSLALDEDAKERIGSTGGVIKELLHIFFNEKLPEGKDKDKDKIRDVAGGALAMLAMDSERNCKRILGLEALDKLVRALIAPALDVNSARIMQNLCTYSGHDCFHKLNGVSAAAPTVLKATMTEDDNISQEVAIGLAVQIFRFTSPHESAILFKKSGIEEPEFAAKLVDVLKQYEYPSTKVPRMRRFVIELVIWMMKTNHENICIFKDLGMEKELENVAETTSELECFNVISGSVGLSRHTTTVYSLVDTALELIANGPFKQQK